MPMLQHYYTSCEKGTSAGAGFQCKRKSPGILAEDERMINSMIGYRIPRSLDEYRTTDHPIALRYQYLGPDKCMLLCSQSNGTDENGRPGNFFAHTIITSPEDFEVYSPIMFWRHPFWHSQDPSDETEIEPVAAGFQETPSLNFEEIWPFLEEGRRRDWFYKLLCAAIYYDQNKRPIIILDDIDNVALWIATVTFALPAVFRPFLTFATYHHDPYQLSLQITGTTKDAKFRFLPDEYISYFILNAETNRISDIEDSVYAEFVCKNFYPDLFEEKLLAFFEMCNNPDRLPPRPTRLAEKLDLVANFYLTIREKTLSAADPKAQAALQLFLDEIEAKSDLLPEDLADLAAVTETVAQALSASATDQLASSYGRALHLLKIHDENFVERCSLALDYLVGFMLQDNEALVAQLFPLYEELFTRKLLARVVGRFEFIAALVDRPIPENWRVQYLIWKYLGPFLPFDAGKWPTRMGLLIQQSLQAINNLSTESDLPTAEANQVLRELITVARDKQQEKYFLGSGTKWQQASSGDSFYWLYYQITENQSLVQRQEYRQLVIENSTEIRLDDLLACELAGDMRSVAAEDLIARLETWINYTVVAPAIQATVISKGLELTWDTCSQRQKQLITERLLTSELLSPHLDEFWTGKLLRNYYTKLRLERLANPKTIKLYEQFSHRPGLTVEQQALMAGSLALTKKVFNENIADDLQKWLSALGADRYRQEAQKLVACFFEEGFDLNAHTDMIKATHVYQYEEVFWELYWPSFSAMLLDINRVAESLRLLSFWFDGSTVDLEEVRYVVPEFFLRLPMILEGLKTSREFRRVARRIDEKAATLAWYPLISHCFVETKKKGFADILLRR